MTDQEKILAAANNLTQADLVSYLMERQSKAECNVCGKNDWEVFNPVDVGLLQIPLLKPGAYPMPPPSVPAMVLVCHNCSNLRLHAALPIAQWKLKKARPNGQ
jgi:hypothetical protein